MFGFAFSMAVILGNIGIMDGFEGALRVGLKKSTGDFTVHSRFGFFDFDNFLKHELELSELENFSKLVQTEGFIIKDETSKGVLIKGIDPDSYESVTGLKVEVARGEVSLGFELANYLNVKAGDFIVLALANGNEQVTGLPSLKRYKVVGIVNHGIYQRDLRTLYVDRSELQSELKVENRVNLVAVSMSKDPNIFLSDPVNYSRDIETMVGDLKSKLGRSYRVKPYWSDFITLIKAVKEEKFFISIILQIIVIISIFNVLAFVVFLNEKRSRELFLFRALGMSKKSLRNGWLYLMSLIWIGSCALSFVMVHVFNLGLKHLPFFKLPGDVYTLGELSIRLDILDYLLVFSVSYYWLFIISWLALFFMSKKSLLSGLRREFS
jgi:ABC-type lipoprotein release transport system permease subunit